MRPVLAGLCTYESPLDGTLDIGDIARMHDALDAQAENQERARIVAKAQSRR